ncbi:MAG: hypothetical protein J7513_02865 [Solirubrobacteraceae bacterium]|nr:hypothetical protein [Solirubrobacteraceae bacterium]
MEFDRTIRWLRGDAHEGSLSALQPELDAEVRAMLRGGQHTEAVHLVRERTGIAPARARRLVDAVEVRTG